MATLEYEGRDATEYRVYVQGPAAYFWFVFRADPETFREMKDEFDSIVDSLELDDVGPGAS